MNNAAKQSPQAGAAKGSPPRPPKSTSTKMADMTNKFMSWTMNVIKESAASAPSTSSPLYGVGVELIPSQPRSSEDGSQHNDAETSAQQHQRKHQVIMIGVLHPTGPAAKMGLRKGDVVVQVNDTPLKYDQRVYTPSDVAQLIRGPEGTFVDVTIERRDEGGDVTQKKFHLRRDPIGIRGRRMLKSNSLINIDAPPASANPAATETADDVKAEQKNHTNTTIADTGVENAETSSNHSANKKKAPPPKMLDRLDLVLSEEKANEKQVLANEEDELHRTISRVASEEKTQDDNDNISSTADNNSDQWELISERSGSAILISINGSLLSGGGSSSHLFRCASPSLLKNKFVLTEYTGDEPSYLEHYVLPTDTLQGLCLAYKVSATQLRMENNFSGNSLQMAPKKIKIPLNGVTKGMMIKTQDKTSKEFKLYAFVAEIKTMELIEAKAYLDLSNWDLEEAIRSAKEDIDYGWDYYNNGSDSPALPMFASSIDPKPKDLTAQDVYDSVPSEGGGIELKGIPKVIEAER